jgi:hypothetical protein
MNLSKYLEVNGLKKQFFSEKLGISTTTLYRYMTGSVKIPKYITLAVRELTKGQVNEICDNRKTNTTTKSKTR